MCAPTFDLGTVGNIISGLVGGGTTDLHVGQIAREQPAADRRQALAYVYFEDERGGRAIVIGTRLR